MGKKNIIRSKKINSPQPPAPAVKKLIREKKNSFLPWLLLVTGITAITLFPMLKNGFTNWDDEFYVIDNTLLRGPDWQGIFTQSVGGNYHPLTIISLAVNYGLTGLDASSYLVFNLLLHLLNTALVFYFIRAISGKMTFVAFLTALIFGIHPMHVESVAWVSERKDLLYCFFFLLSLIKYWQYLHIGKKWNYWLCFLFFLLSLLSKPAAIILPLVLFLLDYWKGRPITVKVALEKIPFFLFALLFGIITLKIQSSDAIIKLEVFSLLTRFFFACYVIMIYFSRFFVPYPLSVFHPFPSADHLGFPVLISPVFIIALVVFLWYQRKNRLLVFGFLFFLVNLLLVLQVISIGQTIVSERYTYVPYIGLAFMLGMWLNQNKAAFSKQLSWLIPGIVIAVFGFITFQRTKVWKDSGALWTDVIKHSPVAFIPRINRAKYASRLLQTPGYPGEKDSLYKQALEDCDLAVKLNSSHGAAYGIRGVIYLQLNRLKEAFADADSLIRLMPDNSMGYDIRGSAYLRLNEMEKAFADFSKCVKLNPDDHRSWNNLGIILSEYYKKYSEALADFNKAITISPQGNYYLNRSICYYELGELEKAKSDAQMAMQMGISIPENFKTLLKL